MTASIALLLTTMLFTQPQLEDPQPLQPVAPATRSVDPTLSMATPLPHRVIYREDGKDLTDEQRNLADRFVANEICFKANGALSLKYNFESMDEGLLEDWQPRTRRKMAVRWSRGWEGSTTHREHGLIISDSGSFLHRARWKNASVNVDYLSTSGTRARDLLATAFIYDNGKRVIGSHLGEQCIKLKGMSRTRDCVPRKNTATVSHDRRLKFGHQMSKGMVQSIKDGSPTVNTRSNPKFTKKVGAGLAGLLWNGRVQGFVFSITIEGELDSSWQLANK